MGGGVWNRFGFRFDWWGEIGVIKRQVLAGSWRSLVGLAVLANEIAEAIKVKVWLVWKDGGQTGFTDC